MASSNNGGLPPLSGRSPAVGGARPAAVPRDMRETTPLLAQQGSQAGAAPGKPVLDKAAEEKAAKGRMLVFAFFAMIVFALGNRVFQKLQTLPMYNYVFFLNMLSVAFYVPLCFAYIIPMVAYGSAIGPEQQAIPKQKFAVMGLLDSLAGVMQVFGVNFITNASILVLLSQAAIPISMAISRTFLGATYTVNQYAGSFVVVLGIVVVMLPSMTGSSNMDGEQNQTFWMGMMVLSCIPMCLSSVYKEKALGETDIDVVYLNGWVALFQFVATIFTAWPSAIAMGLHLSELPQNTMEGFWCWLGYNPERVEEALAASAANGHGALYADLSAASCSWAPFFVTSYLFFNLIFNILMIVILKYGSANILYMSSTALVPLSNVIFSLSFMPNAQPLHVSDIQGLVLIMLGLMIYRFWTPLKKWLRKSFRLYSRDEQEADEQAASVESQVIPRATSFVGLTGSADLLQPLLDTRVFRAQRAVLFRSPQQIRGDMFRRLGIPPSPNIQIRGSRVERSPNVGIYPSPGQGNHVPFRRDRRPPAERRRAKDTSSLNV